MSWGASANSLTATDTEILPPETVSGVISNQAFPLRQRANF
jgi:hypothetical protein